MKTEFSLGREQIEIDMKRAVGIAQIGLDISIIASNYATRVLFEDRERWEKMSDMDFLEEGFRRFKIGLNEFEGDI